MKKKRILFVVIIALLVTIVTAGIVFVFITPKIEVTDISVISADFYFSQERGLDENASISLIQDVFQIAKDESDVSCQLLSHTDVIPSQSISDYSIVIIEMNVSGRSPWDGYIPYALIDDFEDKNSILLITMSQPFGFDIDSFKNEVNCELRMIICSGDKSEEEIASVLNSIQIQIPYTNRVHPNGSVYASCRDADISFQ